VSSAIAHVAIIRVRHVNIGAVEAAVTVRVTLDASLAEPFIWCVAALRITPPMRRGEDAVYLHRRGREQRCRTVAKPAHRGWHDRSHPSPSQTSSSLTPHHCVVRAATDTHQHTHQQRRRCVPTLLAHETHVHVHINRRSACTGKLPLQADSRRTRAHVTLHRVLLCSCIQRARLATARVMQPGFGGSAAAVPPTGCFKSIGWIDRVPVPNCNYSSQQNAVFTTCCIRDVLGCFKRGYAKHMLIWHVDSSDLNAAQPHHHPSSSSSLHVSGGNSKSSSALKGFGRASAVPLASGRAGSALAWLAGACCDC